MDPIALRKTRKGLLGGFRNPRQPSVSVGSRQSVEESKISAGKDCLSSQFFPWKRPGGWGGQPHILFKLSKPAKHPPAVQ